MKLTAEPFCIANEPLVIIYAPYQLTSTGGFVLDLLPQNRALRPEAVFNIDEFEPGFPSWLPLENDTGEAPCFESAQPDGSG